MLYETEDPAASHHKKIQTFHSLYRLHSSVLGSPGVDSSLQRLLWLNTNPMGAPRIDSGLPGPPRLDSGLMSWILASTSPQAIISPSCLLFFMLFYPPKRKDCLMNAILTESIARSAFDMTPTTVPNIIQFHCAHNSRNNRRHHAESSLDETRLPIIRGRLRRQPA